MSNSNQKSLKVFIENQVIKNVKKIRAKHAPFSEIVDSVPKTLSIKAIYNLNMKFKHFYLIIVNNYSNNPKLRYFLAISLANSSSDFLVYLAQEYVKKSELKLIQYSVFPKTLRIQLIILKELKQIQDYSQSLEELKIVRKLFRNKLEKVKNMVENE